MRIIFWQNIISPHQLDFLKALSNNFDITLIVEQVQDSYRAKDGWDVPEYDFLKVVVKPSLDSLDEYFEDSDIIHVFSGISGYKLVYEGFKKAVKYNAKIGVLSEPINMIGIKGILKLLRGNYQRLKYGEKIGFIAATGDLGIQTYLKFGYNKEKLFQWGYFVDYNGPDFQLKKNQAVFVGQLTNRKQIIPLTELFKENKGFGYDEFLILGTGIDEPILKDIINNSQPDFKIRLLGRKQSSETMKIISESKLLVIPSLFDGWAVVVNEALLAGTPIITSDKVGAKILIENSKRGDVFKAGDFYQLKSLIDKWSKIEYTIEDFRQIQDWANNNISPSIAADYFSEILDFAYKGGNEKPIASWVKDKLI